MSKTARKVGQKNWVGDDPSMEVFSPLTDWQKPDTDREKGRLRVTFVDEAMFEVTDQHRNVYEVAVMADATLEIVMPESVSDFIKKKILAAVERHRDKIS